MMQEAFLVPPSPQPQCWLAICLQCHLDTAQLIQHWSWGVQGGLYQTSFCIWHTWHAIQLAIFLTRTVWRHSCWRVFNFSPLAMKSCCGCRPARLFHGIVLWQQSCSFSCSADIVRHLRLVHYFIFLLTCAHRFDFTSTISYDRHVPQLYMSWATRQQLNMYIYIDRERERKRTDWQPCDHIWNTDQKPFQKPLPGWNLQFFLTNNPFLHKETLV